MLQILLAGAALTIGVVATLVLIAAGMALYLLSVRNGLIAQKHSVEKALFEVELLLKQRYDELPKLVGTCKSYMPREQKSFEALSEARTTYARARSAEEKARADETLTAAVQALFGAAEKYPDLKSNSNFIQLRNRLAGLEERAATQRSRYNENVSAFNARIERVPDKLIAGFMNLHRRPLFTTPESHAQHMPARPA